MSALHLADTHYRVTVIPVDRCAELWGAVRYMLKPAVDRSNGRWTMPQVYESLLSGRQNLWLAYDHKGKISAAATTIITVYPNKKMLGVQFLGGNDFHSWASIGLPLMKSFARDCGCDGIEMIGRFGFVKFMSSQKMKRTYAIYEEMFERNN